MSRMRPTAKAASLSLLAAGAALCGQVLYTTQRRDLPAVTGTDASGDEGSITSPRVRVVAVGDSTLTGPGLGDARDIWLRQALRELAADRETRFALQSYATGGARVGHVLHHQLARAIESPSDLLVIVVGTNDATHFVPLFLLRRRFAQLVDRASVAVPRVVIGGVGDLALIARVSWPLSALLRRRGRKVSRVIEEASRRARNVHFIDVAQADHRFREGGRALFSADLFHPNRSGHRLWADVAAPVLAKALHHS